MSLGICSGGMGIVVSHELIHRIDNRFEPLLGRIALASVLYLLFNLQRHPDHHKRPARRYQTLRHFEKSPQLPAGYATMVLVALCPPLWFKIMNPRIPLVNV